VAADQRQTEVAVAKHSQEAAARRRIEKLGKLDPNPLLPGGDPKDPRLALDFAENQDLPALLPESYYFRRFVSLRDALQAYRAESPDPGHIDRAAAEKVPCRKRAINSVLAALGHYPFNYPAAEKVLLSWCRARLPASETWEAAAESRDPEVRTAVELWVIVFPLIWAYGDPRQFFQDEVEKRYPSAFERLPGTLGELLHTWGYGVLLNPRVRQAMDALSRKHSSGDLLYALAEAEGRRAFRDLGRMRTRDKERLRDEYMALPKARGVRARWIRDKANESGRAAASIERYVRPSSVRRRS
jgi:hypothetical protein